MTSSNLYKVLNQQSLLDSKCGIAAGKGIYSAQDQIRVDIHPKGYSWGRLRGSQWECGGFEVADSYETSLRLFQEKITSRTLVSNGQVVMTHLWPSNIQIQPIHQQLSQKFRTLTELDLTAQISPSQLNLTQGFIYRTIEKRVDRSLIKNGDLIGLPIAGLEPIESALPRMTQVARHWGALSVLQVITSRFATELPESILLIIIDSQRVHYFNIQKLQLHGLRSSMRSTLRDTGDLHSTITSLGSETACLLFINLTIENEDLQKIGEELEKNKKLTIRTMGRPELLQAFPDLQNFANSPLFPLSLLLNRNSSSTPQIQSPIFVTPQEALIPQLTKNQSHFLQGTRLIKKMALLSSLLVILLGGYQIYKELTSEEWNVQTVLAQETKIKYAQFIRDSEEYQKTLSTLKSFPRFDLLVEPLFEPPPSGITIEEVKFSSKIIPKTVSERSFDLSVQGTMINGDLLKLRNYATDLESRMKKNLNGFSVSVNDSGMTEKNNASGAAFRLNIKIEVKNHGSI